MDLRHIDLNLLVAFEALMAERSVSAAAARLGVSQPAMSSTLGRLRALFDDELFVRAGRDMRPTTRALELLVPISQALGQFREALVMRGRFDPVTSRRHFNLSGGDYAATVMLPALVARAGGEAPLIDLRYRFTEKDQTFDLLDAGEIDIALGVYPNPPKRFAVATLFEERFLCLARKDHPVLRDGMTLDAFAAMPHVLVTERGDATGAVDEVLRQHGLERRIALTVPYVLVVQSLLPGSDLVATIGARAARNFAESAPLALYDPPLALPVWRLSMLWPREKTSDAGLGWLRDLLSSIGQQA